MSTDPERAAPAAGQDAPEAGGPSSSAPADRPLELIDMIWPETGLQTTTRVPRRPKDRLTEDDAIELQIDFLTLSLTPLEFIQLAAFLRLSIDGLLDLHPGFQRAVVAAFDIRD
jgi:hypothetical protein